MSDYGFNYNQGEYNQGEAGQNFTQVPEQYNGGFGSEGPQGPRRGKKKKKGIAGMLTAVAVSGMVAGGLLTGFVIVPLLNQTPVAQVEVLPNEQAVASAAEESQDSKLGGEAETIQNVTNPVPEIAEQATKSVVGITMYNTTYLSGKEPVEQAISSGTGFVISNDGYIMTNNHVVEEGNTIKVTTSNGDVYTAELVGRDPNTEVAVIKVENLGLPALALGNSDEAKTGEMVVAIGNPLSDTLSNTVTVGYLSSVSRPTQLMDGGDEINMLQTDAAINFGNSGGPLFNASGEVIGINTMKSVYAGQDGYGNLVSAEGIGFAVPINTAMDVAQQLIETGSVPMPVKLGVGFSYSPISAEDAQMWQVPQGIMIGQVVEDGPAAQAGLQVNDIITEIDGVDLTTGAAVPSFADRQVGDKVSATVWRNGQTYQVEFVLADLNALAGN